jgi:hypothetical protein
MYETNFQPQSLNGDIARGHFGLVFRIGEYNGGANDQQVDVEFFPSSGTVRDSFGNNVQPKYDGTDVWTTTSAALNGGDAGTSLLPSLFIDRTAYVSNYVLVANLAHTPPFPGQSTPPPFPLLVMPSAGNDNPVVFDLQYVLGTMKLVSDDAGAWHAQNGNLGGRWATRDILRSVSSLNDSVFGGWVCGSDTIFQVLVKYVCPAADIASIATNDNLVPPASCDALSFGIGFQAGPAQLAPAAFDPPSIPNNCPDAWAPACCDGGLCP